jgi:CheY-like chemotaxis protein
MNSNRTRNRPTTIVLVDDEPVLIDVLASQIRAQSEIVVHATTCPLDVTGLVRAHEPHVVVSDVRMPEMSGIDVVGAVRRTRPGLPFVLMTAFSITELRAETSVLPAISFLQKPFDIRDLIERIDALRAQSEEGGFSGMIAIDSLTDVVQLYVLSNTRGMLEVSRNAEHGQIWIDRGAIVHAACRDRTGPEAFFEILSWKGGSFGLTTGATAPTKSIFDAPTTLMLEACRRQDEAGASARSSEPPVSRTGWSWHPPPSDVAIDSAWPEDEVTTATDLATDELSAFLKEADQNPPKLDVYPKENNMGNVRESLAKLNEVDGFVAACLVDSESGMMIGSEGGGPNFNLEVAAAGNTDVVRTKRKVAKALNLRDDIEDILITLGKQYHLIRPMRTKPTVFFYLAVDRSRANLAMARLKVAEIEKDIVL